MPKRQVYKQTLIPGSPGGKIMSRCWLAYGVLLLVGIGPVCGELGCGQPALASDTGPTGTEASPAGPLTAPHAGQVASHPGPASSPSGSTEATTHPQTNPFSPASPEVWRELAGSLRSLAEALRQLPQQVESELRVVQRASHLAYTAGRWRGWLEGAGIVGALALLWRWVARRRWQNSAA